MSFYQISFPNYGCSTKVCSEKRMELIQEWMCEACHIQLFFPFFYTSTNCVCCVCCNTQCNQFRSVNSISSDVYGQFMHNSERDSNSMFKKAIYWCMHCMHNKKEHKILVPQWCMGHALYSIHCCRVVWILAACTIIWQSSDFYRPHGNRRCRNLKMSIAKLNPGINLTITTIFLT